MPVKDKCFKLLCNEEATHLCKREIEGTIPFTKDYIEVYVCALHMKAFEGFDNDMWTIEKLGEER